MKKTVLSFVFLALLAGCANRNNIRMPVYPAYNETSESEYAPYLVDGTSEISGQAFLVQKNGGTVKAAGRMVTLDPVTTISSNWWKQAGRMWKYRMSLPPSEGFTSGRRSVTADADGRFKFSKLPAGSYYLRTELTWDVAYHGIQGGILAAEHEVKPGETKTVMLNSL